MVNKPVDVIEVFQLGFDSVEVATHVQRAVATTIATTTSPAEGSTEVFVFLVDATVVQNAVASASAASSPTPNFALALVSAFSGTDVGGCWFEG